MEADTSRQGGVADDEADERSFKERIKSHIIGQESAISLVASAIWKKQIGQSNGDRPLVFLFLGPSGVGKTELAKQAAQCVHGDDETGFIRLSMYGYQDRDGVEKLFGSPPGDNWYEHDGVLVRTLLSRNDAVVLLEEIELAHSEVLSALLRVFNEGRFVTGHGQIIESKHAMFIMTSNLASEVIYQQGRQLIAEQETRHDLPTGTEWTMGLPQSDASCDQELSLSSEFELEFVRPILKNHFRDRSVGFLDRIDHMVYFLPFSAKESRMLVQKELEYWKALANRQCGVELSWDPMVIDLIAVKSGLEDGARTIKRDVDERIISKINEKILDNRYPTKKVHITARNTKHANDYRCFGLRLSG